MHERTLLYGALGFTALAAAFGVAGAKGENADVPPPIMKVAVHDPARTLGEAEVPIRLTASDGTGLRLVDLEADAVVEDPLALTEMVMVFENPEARVLEGTFRITLPQGASLSRFAMKVGGTWQEGEVVEKQQARRVYEDFLHRKQDPALLEQGAGNEFSARVFPIPARGRKEIRIAFSQTLETGAPYVLPLRGLSELGKLDVNVHATGRRQASYTLKKQRFTPSEDFVVGGNDLERSPGLRSGELVIARVVPFASSRPDPVRSMVLLVDTSASRALGLAEQTKLVRRMLETLPKDAHVTVACFDQEVVEIFSGDASGFGEKETDAIRARGALGASDVEGALAWAAARARATKSTRVVVVGDGVATAGEVDAQKLKAKVEALRTAGVERIDAVAIGGIRDDGFLRGVVRGVLDKDGAVLDASLGAEAVARRLGEATSSGIPVKVEGATWSYPETLDGLQAGDEVMVYAEVDAQKPVKITIGTQDVTPDLRTSERPLVERAWAQAKIQSLVEAPKDNPAKTKRDIIALSTRHRVLSPHTAMLVLETDHDYQRFGLDRNAKVDILTVQNGRVALTQSPRRWEQEPAKEERSGPTKNDDRRSQKSATASAPPAREAPAAAAPAATATPPHAEAKGRARLDEADGVGQTAAGPQGGLAASAAPASPPPPSDAPSEAFGAGGLGLSGVGQGGGGGGSLGGLGALGGGAGGGRGGAAGASPGRLGDAAEPARPRPTMPSTSPRSPVAQPAPVEAPRPGADTPALQVRPGALVVDHGLRDDDAQRVVRAATPRIRACYTRALHEDPSLRGRIETRLSIDAAGSVTEAATTGVESPTLRSCLATTWRTVTFPAPSTGGAALRASFNLVPGTSAGPDDSAIIDDARRHLAVQNIPKTAPYEGRFLTVMEKLKGGEKESALAEATRWRSEAPGDVLALVALGEAYEAKGDLSTAARAYGSILELYAFRADSRRFAGERLERLDLPAARRLAVDTYGKAAEQRPDHPGSHRLYAFALLRNGEHQRAFEALEKGVKRSYPSGRFAGVDRILREDLGLVAAAWSRAEPKRAAEISGRLKSAGGTEESGPSIRFVLNWETDANDVDFHIYDARGGHAYYGSRELPSGGQLYADVTTGYGPECFTIRGDGATRAHPYVLQAHYYARGPMGYGMGKLEIVEHDGKGGLTFEERPFVVMVDRGYVNLGTVERDRGTKQASLK